jgi:transcriptional regulator with XRE-family HTH domain
MKSNDKPESTEHAAGIAKRLRTIRIEKCLSIQEMASRIDCNRSYLYRLEAGIACNPSDRFLKRIATEFNVNLKWLQTGQGSPEIPRAFIPPTKPIINPEATGRPTAMKTDPQHSMDSQTQEFLQKLDQVRIENDWTWGYAAKQVGLSRTMLHFMRTGKHPVSKRALFKLSKLVNSSTDPRNDFPLNRQFPIGSEVTLPLPGLAGYTAFSERELLEFLAMALYEHRQHIASKLLPTIAEPEKRIALAHSLVAAEFILDQIGMATDSEEHQPTPAQTLAIGQMALTAGKA